MKNPKEYQDQLEALHDKLAADRNISDQEFTVAIDSACSLLKLTDEQAAVLLMTARPTVARWRAGQTHPHSIGRASVFLILRNRVLELMDCDQCHGSEVYYIDGDPQECYCTESK